MNRQHLLYAAWVVALVAATGSLVLSELFHFPPCVLCWYQRIFMYPLVFVLAVAIVKKEPNPQHYVLPLAVPGFLIALYHALLQYGVLPEAPALCAAGVSCTTEYIRWLGFITIPTLSLIAFTLIIAAVVMYSERKPK